MRPRVLVVYKKSTYQRYVGRAQERLEELIEHSDISVDGLLQEHEVHQETLKRAKVALTGARSARAVLRYRPEPLPEEDSWDLIVTLGGDGTLLWASHLADSSTPMVAINSAPDTSVGYFCAGDGHNVGEVLAEALAGSTQRKSPRAHVRRARRPAHLEPRAQRRALLPREPGRDFALHPRALRARRSVRCRAAYGWARLRVRRPRFVPPAARSFPVGSQKIQFVVREPYRGVDNRYELDQGLGIRPVNRSRSPAE